MVTFLARYWRALAIALAVAAVLTLFTRCTHQAEQRGYERARAEMAVQVARANAETAALERRQRDQSAAAAAKWENDRNALQTQVDGLLARAPVVRLCRPAASAAAVPGAGPAAAGTNDAAAVRIDDLQTGQARGLGLVQYGADCERIREQLTALQGWVRQAALARSRPLQSP